MAADVWLEELKKVAPHYTRAFTSETREEFIQACEDQLHDVVRRMEGRRATYRKLDERDLSKLLAELIGPAWASAESDQNGHVDLTLKHPRNLGFVHLTECKIWTGESKHRGGMEQLLRYATGREGRMLMLSFFIKEQRMVAVLESLHQSLDKGGKPPVIRPCAPHPRLGFGAFISHHEHGSGAPLEITHMGCWLFELTP